MKNYLQLWKIVTLTLGNKDFMVASSLFVISLQPLISNVSRVPLIFDYRRASKLASVILTRPYTESSSRHSKFGEIPSTIALSVKLIHQVRLKYLSWVKLLHIQITLSSDNLQQPQKSRNYILLYPLLARSLNPLSKIRAFAYKLRYSS